MRNKEYKKIVDKVIDLGREAAILSSRGFDTTEQNAELTKLYNRNPEAYKDGYDEVKRSFGF